jgi:hypothetical protein
MHRVERAKRAARPLLVFVALCTTAGLGTALVAAPAHAEGWQHCSAVKGSLVMSPGLSDVPTDQSITLFARMTGCSREGGSGLLGATTGASQATCAGLTSALLPTNATFAWASGESSTVALAFRSVPGSPNRLVLEGRVVAGPGSGDRVDGGLHMSAKFTRTLQNAAQNHKRVNESRREDLGPLNGESGDCTMAKPIGAIKIASFESLKFSTTTPPPTTTTASPPDAGAPTISASIGTSTTTPAVAVSPAPKQRPRPAARPRPRRAVIRRIGAVGNATSSGSSLDPGSVLGAICIGAAAVLLVVLLIPSRRMRRRRASARLLR